MGFGAINPYVTLRTPKQETSITNHDQSRALNYMRAELWEKLFAKE